MEVGSSGSRRGSPYASRPLPCPVGEPSCVLRVRPPRVGARSGAPFPSDPGPRVVKVGVGRHRCLSGPVEVTPDLHNRLLRTVPASPYRRGRGSPGCTHPPWPSGPKQESRRLEPQRWRSSPESDRDREGPGPVLRVPVSYPTVGTPGVEDPRLVVILGWRRVTGPSTPWDLPGLP